VMLLRRLMSLPIIFNGPDLHVPLMFAWYRFDCA
jgi:hypothetical protein